MKQRILGWHFLRSDKKLSHGGTLVEAGYIYSEDSPEIKICQSGLHASRRALDALTYAPGPIICRVKC